MSRITILIVDDHAMVRKGLRMAIEAHSDLEVVGEAGNLTEAIEAVIEAHNFSYEAVF